MINVVKHVLIITFFTMIISCGKKEENQSNELLSTQKEQNDRPQLELTLEDSSKLNVKNIEDKLVLILFQPDCSHCQKEAEEIQKRLASFEAYQLYFVSSNPMSEILKFARDYKLTDQSNIHFAWTTTENVIKALGPISAPSLYIYDDDGKLVHHFNGEVDTEKVIGYL